MAGRSGVLGRRMVWLVAALVVLVGALPAGAGEPVAGCGNGFELATIDQVFDATDKRIYSDDDLVWLREAYEAEDANGDGWLCYKQFEPNKGQDKYWGAEDYVVTLVLDNRAEGRLR